MSEDTAGYAQWAERLGKVRLVRTGEFGGLVVADGDGPDEEVMTYAPKTAEEWLRAAAWERPCKGIHDIRHAAQVEKEVWCVLQSLTEVTQTQGAEIALLKARMLALETENEGLRTNIVNMEHRCTCTHNGGGL